MMQNPTEVRRTKIYLERATLAFALAVAIGYTPILRAQAYRGEVPTEESSNVAPHCPAANSVCRSPSLAVDPSGHLYFATSSCVFRVEGAGHYKPLAALPAAGIFSGAVGLAADNAGNIFISDYDLGQVRKVASDGSITVVAGGGSGSPSSDGELAINAPLSRPQGIAVDSAGNLYIAETGKGRVRKVLPDGTIKTVVSHTKVGTVAVDAHRILYMADGSTVYRSTADGLLTRVAGTPGVIKYSGENGQASQATLDAWSLAVDTNGVLYIADFSDARILKIADGTITTVAGGVGQGFSGDGGPATHAKLAQPTSIAVDGTGNLYFADVWDVNPPNRGFSCDSVVIRKVQNGTITTVVGGPGISLP
jgi:trimeric autotransporter adhesin